MHTDEKDLELWVAQSASLDGGVENTVHHNGWLPGYGEFFF